MDQPLANEIISLVLDLSKLTDEEKIIGQFIDFFNSRLDSISLEISLKDNFKERETVIPLSASFGKYGHVIVRSHLRIIPSDTLKLLTDAVGMLALVLENKKQAQHLQRRKKRLDDLDFQTFLELLQTDSMITAILKTIPDPVAIYTRKGHCIYINPAFTEIFGWNLKEFNNLYEDFIPQEQVKQTERIYQDLFNQNLVVKFENQRITKNGRQLNVLISVAAITTGKDQREAMIAVYTDFTETKRLSDQLRQSQKMEALGTLAEGIALDINDMLGIIIGNSELAIDDIGSDNPIREYLNEIKIAALRACDVIRQLVAIDQKDELVKLPLNPGWIVEKFLKQLRLGYPASISIMTEIEPNLPPILADHSQIKEILQILCNNALEFMPKKNGILNVRLKQVFLDRQSARKSSVSLGHYVRIELEANGPGLDPAIQSRIFDPYFSTKSSKTGSGLGLAVVRGIVKSHHGAIDLTSKPGRGTTISILLPVVPEFSGQNKLPQDNLFTGDERILFVDDDAALLKLAKKILTRLGYQVETQMNPIDALGLIKKSPNYFDLIIVARNMFRMSGSQFIKRSRSIAPNIPIIVSSGKGDTTVWDRLNGIGNVTYIKKPLERRLLAKIIRYALDGKI